MQKLLNHKKIHPLVKRDYIVRLIITISAIPACIALLLQYNAGPHYYIILITASVLWPNIAFLLACSSKDQKKVEQYVNITLDPLLYTIWIPFFQFNPLIVIMMVAMTGSVGITVGGVKLLITRIIASIIGLVFGILIFGVRYNPESTNFVIITLGLSMISYNWAQSVLTYTTMNQLSRTRKDLAQQKTGLEILSSKLSKYLSPQIYNSIFTGKRDVRIETARKKLTVFFSDIQNFARTTDSIEPEELSNLLNEYLQEMTEIAIKHGGTIDKFIGDAIMIFFGDPETRGDKEDAVGCVSMALDMRSRMIELRVAWMARGIRVPLHVRMGINTGYCTVGNFGSSDRYEYTIVGGQVNLASRLESHAEPDQILISEDTYLLIQDIIVCKMIGEIAYKGISKPVKTYQVIDWKKNLDQGSIFIKEEHDGISIAIDLTDINAEKAADVLNDVIQKIRNA